jgi:hypothetical protein
MTVKARSMFKDWSEFYLLAGSAAAVLIGLIFVVMTLMQDRSRSSVLAGSRLYMGPVVLQVSFVLALSSAALVPEITRPAFAAVCGAVALWGFARGVMSLAGIAAIKGPEVHWTDKWFYGAIPTALFAALAVVAWGFWSGQSWATVGAAAVITGILLLAIRNEWDLVTWLAPRPDEDTPDLRMD